MPSPGSVTTVLTGISTMGGHNSGITTIRFPKVALRSRGGFGGSPGGVITKPSVVSSSNAACAPSGPTLIAPFGITMPLPGGKLTKGLPPAVGNSTAPPGIETPKPVPVGSWKGGVPSGNVMVKQKLFDMANSPSNPLNHTGIPGESKAREYGVMNRRTRHSPETWD